MELVDIMSEAMNEGKSTSGGLRQQELDGYRLVEHDVMSSGEGTRLNPDAVHR